MTSLLCTFDSPADREFQRWPTTTQNRAYFRRDPPHDETLRKNPAQTQSFKHPRRSFSNTLPPFWSKDLCRRVIYSDVSKSGWKMDVREESTWTFAVKSNAQIKIRRKVFVSGTRSLWVSRRIGWFLRNFWTYCFGCVERIDLANGALLLKERFRRLNKAFPELFYDIIHQFW